MKIFELLIDELDKLTGVDAVALVEEPAMEADFYAFNNKEIEDFVIKQIIEKELFVERMPGEGRDEYIGRCIPVLKKEGYDEDQAAAICYDALKKNFAEERVILPVEETTILQAGEEERGLRVDNNEDKSYDVAYWWKDDSKPMAIEVELDGKPAGYAENVHLKFHPELDYKKDEFESFTDYPESATNAAKRALEWKDEHPDNDCGTRVGWARANQLANKRAISEETIARMASFARHLQHEDVPYSEGCGGLMVDAWGGRAGIEWAKNKLESIREENSAQTFAKHGSNEKYTFAVDQEQQMVVGPLMIPDKLIFRLDEQGEPYYVFFSKDTIRQIAQKMMKDKHIDSVNLEHNPDDTVDGYMVSTWIVEDEMKDKQQVYGFNYPAGTWFGQYKIEDMSVWEKVKEGAIKGFSVEGFFADKFVQAKKQH